MLHRCPVLFTCIILLTGLAEALYLPDYEYLSGHGWLRLHIVPETWEEARLRCNLEGDILASPTTSAITTYMKTTLYAAGLTKTSVFVDLHVTYPHGVFMSVDGTHLSNISLEWAEGEPDNQENAENCLAMTDLGGLADVNCDSAYPYFCLKKNETGILECVTKDKGYKVEPSTKSCYKFHNKPLTWRRAAMACAAERAHLAVINNDVEALVLQQLFVQHPKVILSYEGARYTEYAHVGVWDWNEKNEWVNIFGEKLADTGYDSWAQNQPDNPEKEYCGSITRDALLNDISCFVELAYICESTVKQ